MRMPERVKCNVATRKVEIYRHLVCFTRRSCYDTQISAALSLLTLFGTLVRSLLTLYKICHKESNLSTVVAILSRFSDKLNLTL